MLTRNTCSSRRHGSKRSCRKTKRSERSLQAHPSSSVSHRLLPLHLFSCSCLVMTDFLAIRSYLLFSLPSNIPFSLDSPRTRTIPQRHHPPDDHHRTRTEHEKDPALPLETTGQREQDVRFPRRRLGQVCGSHGRGRQRGCGGWERECYRCRCRGRYDGQGEIESQARRVGIRRRGRGRRGRRRGWIG